MSVEVEFHFDVVSPASYLAWRRLPKLLETTAAKMVCRPFFLPALFERTGGASPIEVPAKGKWLFRDLERFAERDGVEFRMNPYFPLSSVYVMRGLLAWSGKAEFLDLADGFFSAMWARRENVNDPETLGEILRRAKVDPRDWKRSLEDPANKQALFDATESLVSRGAFGAPTFFVGEEMFWGQDRLDFVLEAIERA